MAGVTSRFVRVGDGFDVERAGRVIRIWCGTCDKHEHLPNDDAATIGAAKAAHRCGERVTPWSRGDVGGRP